MGGATSEEVGDVLGSGKFGMVRETAEHMNGAINKTRGRGHRVRRGIGSGYRGRAQRDFLIRTSVFWLKPGRERFPVTVHVAVGTDTIHAHPSASGEAIGEASFHDFRLFSSVVRELDGGRRLSECGIGSSACPKFS